MKIVYLNPTGVLGGAERVLLDAMISVRARNPHWQLSLIAAAGGPLVEAARDARIAAQVLAFPAGLAALGDAALRNSIGSGGRAWRTISRLGAASPAIAAYRRRLRRTIVEAAPDLVHANGFKMHVLGAWSIPAQAALLWHIHDYLSPRPLMRPLLRMFASRCAAIIANSHSTAGDIRAALGPAIVVHTVYNAVDLDRFLPTGPRIDLDACAALPAPAGAVVRIGLIATAARWKGLEVFLRAIALLAGELPVRAYIIGAPLYQTADSQYTLEEMRDRACQLGVNKRVGFTGYLAAIAPAMRALDIVVHASTAPEPFGLVIAEALACGRSLITTASGGAAELVTAEKDAVIAAPGDAPGLAMAMTRLVHDAQLRSRLGQAARQTALQRFDRARLGSELTTIYRGMIAAGPGCDDAAAAHS